MSAVTADEAGISPSLRFAASESRVVGFGGSWMNTIRANAARIVGMLKLAGDKQAEARGNYDLGDFGHIITHGSVKEPESAIALRVIVE